MYSEYSVHLVYSVDTRVLLGMGGVEYEDGILPGLLHIYQAETDKGHNNENGNCIACQLSPRSRSIYELA